MPPALCTMHYAIHQAAMSDPQTNCHWISRRPLGPLGPLKVDKRAPTLSQVWPFVKPVRAGAKVDIVTNANNKMNSRCSCLNLIFPVVFVFPGDLSSPKRAGPKGPCAESARAVTGRRCPHSGRGEDFLSRQPDFFTETAVTPERKVEKWFPRWEINRHVEG